MGVAPAITSSTTRPSLRQQQERTLSVVFLGLDHFPFGLAETQRVRLISTGLIHHGCHVTVVSRWWGGTHWREAESLPAEGVFEGIRYINVSGSLTRPASWLRRKLLRIRGLLYEPMQLLRLRKESCLDAAIVSSGDFLKVAYYGLLAKVLHFPLLLNSVEFYSATTRSKRPTARLKAWLRDRSAYAFVDGVLPISEFLLSRAVDMAPHKPVLKVSVVADIDRFSHLKRNPDHLYFLFCGSLIYLEVVEFILDAFERMEANEEVSLYLVLNGSSREFERFNGRLRRSTRYTSIRVFSKITDQEVAALYVDAFALLIPLRPTLQDEARFPHKIAEYCASGRPIITTNVGEVPVYFRNNENAVVVEHYDVNEYTQAMKELLNHPENADRIGRKGLEVAQSEFNHLVSAGKVRTFFDSFGL